MNNRQNEICLDTFQLQKVQSVLLELLCEVRRICNLERIPYSIIAGTMLGAVRHGGFIPWDDDADIGMLRNDYEAFCIACEKHLDTSRFYFQDHMHTKGYRWGYGKLRRKDSLYVVRGTEHLPYEQGIWIDIFPLDYVPNSRIGRTICNAHCFCIRKLFYSAAGKYRASTRLQRTLYSFFSKIPLETVVSYYNRYVQYRNKKQTDWVRILMFPTPNKQCGYLSHWYKQRANITFEGETFSAIRDYHEYLSFKFGDYMTLPPLEQRKQHKVSKLKFPGSMEG